MEGRRSSDNVFVFGFPKEFDQNNLPTNKDIVSHAMKMKRDKINVGEWRNNTAVSDVARAVANDVCEQWEKTDIPHHGTHNPKWVREKVEKLLTKSKAEFLKNNPEFKFPCKNIQTYFPHKILN